MALGFWFNPSSSASNGPVNLTESQWRAGLVKYFNDPDSIQATQVANPDLNWVRTPDGDYWYGNGPGTFQPTASNIANVAMTSTQAQGDVPVGG